MKLLTFILTINSIICFGQELFVDNIKNFSWTSDEQFEVDQIGKAAEIGLSILRLPKDSLKTNRIIWTFKEDLILSRFNSRNREEKVIAQCEYDFDWDKGLLNIQWPDKGQFTYRFTFISTGSYMLLAKKTRK